MKRLVLIMSLVLVLFVSNSCKAQDAALSVDDIDTEEEVVRGINKLTFDLFQQLRGENIFFSTYSIVNALGMTYGGAEGETAKEMSEVLYFSDTQSDFHLGLYKLNRILETRQRDGVILNKANALWLDKALSVRSDYLELTKRLYDGETKRVDFQREPEKSRLLINSWVEEKTAERIKDLLEPGTVGRDTRLILTNAIYFLGNWQTAFPKENTRDQTFHLDAERQVPVPFMQREGDIGYAEDEKLRIVEIPYVGDELSMLILLPPEETEVSELLAGFRFEHYERLVSGLTVKKVNLQIPRFIFETKYDLKDIFEQLGLQIPFSERADFTGISAEGRSLVIDEIVHQAFVEVKEEGTEAAAATAVEIRLTSFQPEERTLFRADRPFLFFIRDIETGVILFSGVLGNPKQ